jgi:LmbE family N-acetylglucosaminyl deacetylase
MAGSVVAPLYPPVATTLRHALYRIGNDTTEVVAGRPCLVVAPHPDDETLAAGATIMRKRDAGTPVRVLVATDGSQYPEGDPAEIAALRARELQVACGVLGLVDSDVTRLPFADADLARHTDALAEAIAQAVREFEPTEVLATSETDPHEDHAALGTAARRALAGTGIRLLTYPIWQWDRPPRLLRMVRRSRRPELVGTGGYMERKRRAIAAYGSQLASGAGTEGLTPRFLQHFEGRYELFFPVAH